MRYHLLKASVFQPWPKLGKPMLKSVPRYFQRRAKLGCQGLTECVHVFSQCISTLAQAWQASVEARRPAAKLFRPWPKLAMLSGFN